MWRLICDWCWFWFDVGVGVRGVVCAMCGYGVRWCVCAVMCGRGVVLSGWLLLVEVVGLVVVCCGRVHVVRVAVPYCVGALCVMVVSRVCVVSDWVGVG